MTDQIPHCEPPGLEFQKMVDESVKAREEFVKTPEFVVRTAENYLKNMTCDVSGGNHPTYDKDGKCLCVTLPASLVLALVNRVKELEEGL